MSDARIVHMTTVHQWNDSRIFLKECSSIAVKGNYDTHLLCATTTEGKTVNSVQVHPVEAKSKTKISRMTQTVRNMYRAARKLDGDLYHFHDPEMIPIGILLRLKGKKVVYDVHEDLPKQIITKKWIPFFFRRPLSFLAHLFDKLADRCLSGIVAATPSIATNYSNVNTVTINNFPLLAELPELDSLEITEKKYAFCYTGGLTEIRGIEQMIQALELVNMERPAEMVIAGKFQSEAFREKITNLPGWRYVTYHEWLERPDMYMAIQQSKAGIIPFQPVPNHVDARPNKMFEYMAAGVPILCSYFPQWKEIIEGSSTGWCFNPESVEDIAQKMLYVLDHPQEAKEAGINAREEVVSKYNFDQEVPKLLALYNHILTDCQ